MSAESPSNECVPTDWPIGTGGYGQRRVDGRYWQAHRWAWARDRGPIPDGMLVLHHCDNPPCVRTEPSERYPDGHLFLGTQADNMADMNAKGRGGDRRAIRPATGERHGLRLHPERRATGERHGSRTHPERFPGGSFPHASGERHPNARLTAEEVRAIKGATGQTQRELAARYGVSASTVGYIRSGKRWSRVEAPCPRDATLYRRTAPAR